MSSYVGHYADFYDVFYRDKPYQDEARFIDACLRRFELGRGERLLELACGTGSHALEFARLGYQVTATDASEDMLRVARAKATRAGGAMTFARADMREIRGCGGPFDAAVCLFDSIGYVSDNDSVHRVLAGVLEHLAPGGLFVFEFWHAAAMLRHYDPVRVRRFATPHGTIVRVSETALDAARQLARVTYTVYDLHADGTYATFSETHRNRFFLVEEMRAAMVHAGLEPVTFYAGFDEAGAITEDTWHILAVARRPVLAGSRRP